MNWDEVYFNNKGIWEIDAPQILNRLPDIKGGLALDLGCGVGAYAELLQKKGVMVTGLDSSKVAIEEARKRVPDAKFEVFDLNNLKEYNGGKFDLILDIKTLAFVDDEKGYLQAVRNLLNPNGYFFIQLFKKSPNHTLIAKTTHFPFKLKDSWIVITGDTEAVTYLFQL
jgi:2-polyprenyl-3-methyl-5-hydroxy-6-metoxy-1,4-benzoquinol methylase